jgi:hypothetical protein
MEARSFKHKFPQNTPLHLRLGLCNSEWKAIGASPTIRRWITHGVPVEFTGTPPKPFRGRSITPTPGEKKWWFNTEMPRLVKQGSLFQYPDGVVPEYCSAAFMVPKGSDNFRLVINNKPVNIACTVKRCKYDTLKLLSRLPVQNAWAVKADMKDAYYQVPVLPAHRKYLAFEVCGKFYHLNCLPFGWCNSPWYFTKIVRAFVAYVRSPKHASKHKHTHAALDRCIFPPSARSGRSTAHVRESGCMVLPYLDDFLFIFSTQQKAQEGSAWVHALMYWLGFTPHPTKSVWEPSQQVEHLGLLVDFKSEQFGVPVAKVARARNMAKQLRIAASANKRLVTKKALASFTGFAQSLSLAVRPAQLFLRSMYSDSAQVKSWSGSVRLSRRSMQDLLWWQQLLPRFTVAPMVLRPGSPELFVDACKSGWGAVLAGKEARGQFSARESTLDIAVLEMRAVRRALACFSNDLRNRCVLLREDNTVTEAAIRNHSSRSKQVMAEYRMLWEEADELSVLFKVVRVASADNTADAPSRVIDKDNFTLAPGLFRNLECRWGRFDVDLFASDSNRQPAKCFFSLYNCPGTSGVDALLQCWAGLRCFAYPPYSSDCMLQVVQKLRLERLAEAVVVVPEWPSQAWFRELLDMADHVLRLPRTPPSWAGAPPLGLRPVLAVHVPPRP